MHNQKASQSGSGAPTGVTAEFIGQVYVDTDNDNKYIAHALTEGAFKLVVDAVLAPVEDNFLSFTVEGGVRDSGIGPGAGIGVMGGGFDHYGIYVDEKSSGTPAGASVADAWYDRTLNTEREVFGDSISLLSDEVTLKKGYRYLCRFTMPMVGSGSSRAKLRNVTDSFDEILGSSVIAASLTGSVSYGEGVIDLRYVTENKVFKIQYYCNDSVGSNGLGADVFTGEPEVYTAVAFYRLVSMANLVSGGFDDYAILRDEKPYNTDGGTFTQDAWQTRDLNTVLASRGTSIVLGTNQFVLRKGFRYWVEAKVPAYNVGGHRTRIYNISDAALEFLGQLGFANDITTETHAFVEGVIDLLAVDEDKTFELQHWCDTTKASDGFGSLAPDDGGVEVYSQIKIKRLQDPASTKIKVRAASFSDYRPASCLSAGGQTGVAAKWWPRLFGFEQYNNVSEYVEVLNWAITEADTGSNFFKVVGDQTVYFPAGHRFVVWGSTGNDSLLGFHLVTSSSFSAGETTINVASVVDATADGTISNGMFRFKIAKDYIVKGDIQSIASDGVAVRLVNIFGFTYTDGYVDAEGGTKTDRLGVTRSPYTGYYSCTLSFETQLSPTAGDVWEVQQYSERAQTANGALGDGNGVNDKSVFGRLTIQVAESVSDAPMVHTFSDTDVHAPAEDTANYELIDHHDFAIWDGPSKVPKLTAGYGPEDSPTPLQIRQEFISVSRAMVNSAYTEPVLTTQEGEFGSVQYRVYPDGVNARVNFLIPVPDDFDLSRDSGKITIELHCVVSAATAPTLNQGCSFKVHTVAINDAGGNYQPAAWVETVDHFFVDLSNIVSNQWEPFTLSRQHDMSVWLPGDKLLLCVQRDWADGVDDYPQDIGIVGIIIHWPIILNKFANPWTNPA